LGVWLARPKLPARALEEAAMSCKEGKVRNRRSYQENPEGHIMTKAARFPTSDSDFLVSVGGIWEFPTKGPPMHRKRLLRAKMQLE
jgi:hypothetical protein